MARVISILNSQDLRYDFHSNQLTVAGRRHRAEEKPEEGGAVHSAPGAVHVL